MPDISKQFFEKRMRQAQAYKEVMPEKSYFFDGYMRGIRRAYHGDTFGTEAEHIQWHGISGTHPDINHRMLGQGYRAGCEGLYINDLIKKSTTFTINGYEMFEKTVKPHSTSAHIGVPKSWIGSRVAVVRLDNGTL